MRKFKLFFACLLMAVLSIGQMWGADESVDFSTQGYSNQQAITSYSGTDFSITFDKGTNNNAPKYYTSGTAIRAYGANYFIVSSTTKTIKKIELTFGSSDGSNAITTDVETYENGTWTGSATSVKFTIGGTSGNRRIKGVAVTYVSDKQDADLAYAAASQKQLVKLGDSFTKPALTNPNSLTVSYASDNTDVAEVANDGTVTIKAIGKTVITASFAGNDDYKAGSASYTIFVAEQAGTEADPLTGASAKALIDLDCDMNVYVKDAVNTKNYYPSKTYTITLANGFQFYYFYAGPNNATFDSDYLKIGDILTAYGKLTKSGTNYRLNPSYMVDRIEFSEPLVDISNEKETAYTVAQALALATDPTSDITKAVYIRGVVYQADYYSNSSTYNIYIKDANAENQFEFYKCASLHNAGTATVDQLSDGDVQVGNEVIGYGVMKYFGSTWELDADCYLVDLQKPVTGISGLDATAEVEAGKAVELTATILPSNAKGTIVWSVVSGSDKASVDNGTVTGLAKGEATIRATVEGTSIYAECVVTVNPAPSVEAPTFSPVAGTYTSVQNVALACATEGATIYYTTNGDDPDNNSTEYTAPISVGEDMTIKAIAIKEQVSSTIAEAAYVINLPLSTMDQIFAAATAAGKTATDVNITFNNWIVTGIRPSNAYVTDGEKGFIIYASSHGFAVGDVLSGTVSCKVQLYNGAAELTNLTSSTEGLTVTPDGSATLHTKTIDQLGAINTSSLVKINNLTYNTNKLSDGTNEITPYNGLFAMAFENGKTYNVTGVVSYYNALQIMPRSADDIVEVVLENAELSYSPAAEEITVGDAWSAPTFNNPNNLTPITYGISGDAVATVSDAGVIELVENATGTAIITASYAGDATYAAGNATYTITVNATAAPVDPRSVATASAFTAISGDMTSADITFAAYKGDGTSNPVVRSTDNPVTIRLYKPASGKKTGGYITVKAKVGCTIDQVKVDFSGTATASYSVNDAEFTTTKYIENQAQLLTPTELDAQSVSIVNLKNNSIDISEITVYYTGEPLAVDHYFLGGTYPTEFMQYGTFNYEGLEVYAAYDAEETIKEAVTGFTVEADLNTSGQKKAYVYLNEVKIAEYDITVTESPKEDPALAYTPSVQVVEAVEVASWEAPAFSNTFNVSPITYSSNKPAVATVDENGVIALAGGYGTAVITATFAETDAYIASVTTYTITVNEPVEDLSGTWIVATSVAAGDRIIIGATYQNATLTMGKQNSSNRAAIASDFEDAVLTPAEGTKTFTLVDAGEGKFALRALNGKYLTSATTGTNNNLLEADNFELDNAKWTISINEQGVASVVAAAGNRTYLKYNPNTSNNNPIFSCYQYSTSQQPINIYKIGTPDYGTYNRDNLTIGNYGTICLPKKGTIAGATLFEIADYKNGMIYCDELGENEEMVAGRPYIFLATATELNVTYTSGIVAEEAGNANGLYGFYNLENENATLPLADDASLGNYILYQNQYWLVSGRAATIANYRAYIKIGEINYVAPAPGRRRVAMNVNGEQTATGINELNAAEAPVKMIMNGQLYILRGEKLYNANGQIVK